MARRTKEDALATRTALLDAAERVFLQQGVSRTSLADIAQAASVTRGALYWHFKDKAALFSAMLDRVALPLSAELEELLNREGDVLAPWCVQMRHVLHQIAHDARARRVLQIVMQKAEHAQDLGPVLERHVARHRMSIDCLRQLLERAAAARHVRLPAPALQLAHGLDSMVRGLIYNWLLDRGFDLESTGQVAIEAYLRGIGLAVAPGAGA